MTENAATPTPAAAPATSPAAHTDADAEKCQCAACRVFRGRVLAGSEANRLLVRLEKVLLYVARLCDRWADRHGVGCPCPFCARRKRRGELRMLTRDLAGVRWAAESGHSFISSLTYDPPDDPQEPDASTVVEKAPHLFSGVEGPPA